MKRFFLIVLALLSLSPAAWAAEPPFAGIAAPANDNINEIERRMDASIDRGILSPHAETVGEGKLAFNSYELFLAGLTYGITDSAQISVTTLAPIIKDFPIVLLFNGKYTIFRDSHTVVSVNATFDYFSITSTALSIQSTDGFGSSTTTTTTSTDRAFLFGGGIAVDRYLGNAPVALHASFQASGVGGAFGGSGVQFGSGALLTASFGVTARLGEMVKLLGEFWVPAAMSNGRFEVAPIGFVSYGIRFHGPKIAADVSFVKFTGDLSKDDPFVLGFPVVSFNARW